MGKSNIRVRGITIEIAAEMSGLVKQFKSANTYINSFKGNLAALEKNIIADNSWSNLGLKFDALKQKQSLLVNQIEQVRNKLDIERAALANLATSDQTPEVIAKQQALQTEILLDQKRLAELEQELKNFGSIGKQEALAVADSFKDLGSKFSEVGDKLISTGRNMSMYVTAPIIGLGTTVSKTAMDFETAMDKVQSVTLGATAEDMDKLTESALELSGKSKYSAAEAAEALYYMGLAGWNVNEMLRALPDVLDLATAGDLELGRASDIVTDYITAFGLTAQDATAFVDTMAKTMVNSNTDVDQLGDAFKYIAPVAGALGYSVEDVSLALGLMANNGIKASQAGTALRQFMQRMAKPTAEVEVAMENLGLSLTNDNGEIKSFKEVMDDLRTVFGQTNVPAEELTRQIQYLDDALENGEMSEDDYGAALEDLMSKAYGLNGAEKARNAAILAGVRGMSGLLAIINTTAEDYDTLTEAINGTSQSAESIADIMLDNTEGSFLKMRHSAQNLAISFGKQLLPKVNDLIDGGQEMIDKFSALDDETKDMIIQAAGLAAAIGPLLIVGGSLIKAIGSISSGLGGIIGFAVGHPIATAVGALAATIGTAIIASEAFMKQHEAERLSIWGLTEEQNNLVEKINESVTAYQEAQTARAEMASAINTEYGYYQNLADELSRIVDENGRVKAGYEERAQFIVDTLNNALGSEIELNDHIIVDYQTMQTEIQKLIEQKQANAILTKYEQEYSDAINNSATYYHNYTEAAKALEEQQLKVSEAEAAVAAAQEAVENSTRKTGLEYLGLKTALNNAEANLAAATKEQDRLSDAMEDAYEVYIDSQNYIENYEEALEAMATGGVENARDALLKLQNDFKSFGTATESQLKDQVRNYKALYEQSQKDIAAGVAGVSQEVVQGYAEMVRMAEAELYKFYSAGNDSANSYKSGFESVDMRGPGSEAMDEVIEGANSRTSDIENVGKNFIMGFARGIRNNIPIVEAAAADAAAAAAKAPNPVLLIGSPSKLMEQTGKYYDQGFALGIKNNSDLVSKEAALLADNAASAMAYNTASPNYGISGGNGSSSKVTNYGGVSIVVNATPNQNANDIADEVMNRIYLETNQRQAVLGW